MSFASSLVAHPAPWLIDEDGRPVAEVGAEVPGTASTELAACPYGDRRAGGLMNRSALRQMASCWPEVRVALRAYVGPAPVTVHGAFAGAFLATAAVTRHHARTPGVPVDRVTSSLYKASLGLSQVFAALCMQDAAVGPTPLGALGDADGFFRFLDDGGWLVGQVQVCGGSQAMIADVFDAWVAGGEGPPAWGGDAMRTAGFVGASLLAAPLPDPLAPALARLMGPKGPSWVRSLFGVPGRRPRDVLRLFPVESPERAAVSAFADDVEGRDPVEVEARLWAAVR